METLYLILAACELLILGVVVMKAFPTARAVAGLRGTLMLVIVVAGGALALTVSQAGEFPVSDAVEYVVGAWSTFEGKGYTIPLDGRWLPPRYPPWFSLLVCAPAMAVAKIFGAGVEISLIAPSYGVMLIAVVMVGAVAFGAGRIGGAWAAVISAFTVLLLPGLRYFSQQALIDIPLALCGLCSCLLYASVAAGNRTALHYLFGGGVSALAGMLRPTGYLFALPWIIHLVRDRAHKDGTTEGVHNPWRGLVLIAMPIAIGMVATLLYQRTTFGDLFRTGYQFWLTVPYDVPSLVFHSRYLLHNGGVLLEDTGLPLLWVGIGAILLIRRRGGLQTLDERRFGGFLTAAVVSSAALLIPHLFYFYVSPRFFLPLGVLAALPCGVALGRMLAAAPLRAQLTWGLVIASVAISIISANVFRAEASEHPLHIASHLRRATPPDAVIITGHNLALLYPVIVANSERTLMPISRRVEFASKLLMPSQPRPGTLAHITDPTVHRSVDLKDHGAEEAVLRTAVENPQWIVALLRASRSLYLDLSSLTNDEWLFFQQRFSLVSIQDEMIKVELPPSDAP